MIIKKRSVKKRPPYLEGKNKKERDLSSAVAYEVSVESSEMPIFIPSKLHGLGLWMEFVGCRVLDKNFLKLDIMMSDHKLECGSGGRCTKLVMVFLY